MSLLSQVAIFLAAAVIAVPLFRRFHLGAVLGYLAAGIAIGPHGLGLVGEAENVMHLAELGVVLLLFVIGLELQPSRLWVLRKTIFGLGGAQVLLTGVIIAVAGLAFGLTWQAALVIGLALSMSSTAFVLQILAERGELTTRHGRSSFAILLFQDMAVIPLLALIPLLGAGEEIPHGAQAWSEALQAVGMIVLVVVGGRYLLRPLFSAIAASRIQEIFTAAALLTVIGTALLVSSVGLSMSLGAFLAGVLLADSEFRHELEANIEPFKGLLLGLFFISVGMSVDLGLLTRQPLLILGGAVALMLVKAAVLFAIGRYAGHSAASARRLAAALAQGGEFAFVLFAVALNSGIMTQSLSDTLVIVVSLSMMLTPLALALDDWASRLASAREEEMFDAIQAEEAPVVIAGFGRMGQIVGRILRARGIAFTALDKSSQQIESVRRFGLRAYYGDASRLDLLRAARTDKARLFVLAIDDVEASLQTAETVKRNFPGTKIIARARNRFHAYRLMDLGIDPLVRETFLSSLDLGEKVLRELGLSEWLAKDTVATFRRHDEEMLIRQHAVYHDETQLIQTTQEAARELEGLFESDNENGQRATAGLAFTPDDVR
jgi:glutathione-regulated potassium-efflux system ancillary protein KefC/glutathione-regulated potassium-efflux system protein KefB